MRCEYSFTKHEIEMSLFVEEIERWAFCDPELYQLAIEEDADWVGKGMGDKLYVPHNSFTRP